MDLKELQKFKRSEEFMRIYDLCKEYGEVDELDIRDGKAIIGCTLKREDTIKEFGLFSSFGKKFIGVSGDKINITLQVLVGKNRVEIDDSGGLDIWVGPEKINDIHMDAKLKNTKVRKIVFETNVLGDAYLKLL